MLLAAQLLIPPVTGNRRSRWLIASARQELDLLLSRGDRRYAPEEAMFRDAVRVGQIAASVGTGPLRGSIGKVLSYFDQAAAIRLCGAKLTRLADGPSAGAAAEARTALVNRDADLIRASARRLRVTAPVDDPLATSTSAALVVASAIIDAARPQAANAPRGGDHDTSLP